MKIADDLPHVRSYRGVFRSAPDQLAMLGEIELAARDPIPPGRVLSLLRNNQFLFFVASTSWMLLKLILLIKGYKIDIVDWFWFVLMLYISIASGRRLLSRRFIPKFAVCERGLWFEKNAIMWEQVHDCSWSQYRKNVLIVSLVYAKGFVQIPADQAESFETAIRKHGKM